MVIKSFTSKFSAEDLFTTTPNPAINREQQVIDGLINSGNYDVYDDGKYIKIARKKKIK